MRYLLIVLLLSIFVLSGCPLRGEIPADASRYLILWQAPGRYAKYATDSYTLSPSGCIEFRISEAKMVGYGEKAGDRILLSPPFAVIDRRPDSQPPPGTISEPHRR